MYSKRLNQYAFLCIFIFIFIIAWFFQSTLLINTDASWLLEASKRMLSGGNYTNDFFENNPPWILYFYAPPVLFAKLLSINIILSFRMYVFLLATLSIVLSYFLLERVFLKSDLFLAKLLLVMLTTLFILFSSADFGQREHLLFILIMPYFFMMVLRLQAQRIAYFPAFMIGLLAGSVLMLKPYFLMSLLLVEGYYLLGRRQKSNYHLIRPEVFAILFLLLTYLIILFVRHADYLNLVMPFALRWCYLGSRRSWANVLINIPVVSCFLSFFFYMFTYEMNRYKYLTNILMLGLVGFIFSYLIQQVDYFYHILPALSLSIIINLLLFSIYITTPNKNYTPVFVGLFILFILVFIDNMKILVAFDIMLKPLFSYYFLTGVFVSILYLASPQLRCNTRSKLMILFLPPCISYLFYWLTTPWFYWSIAHLITTCFVLILSFSLLIPGSLKNKSHFMLISMLGILIFFMPFYYAFFRYDAFKEQKKDVQNMIAFINTNAPNQSIYFFTTNIAHAFPVISYTQNTHSASRFSFFWALAGLLKQSSLPMDDTLKNQLFKDKYLLVNMVADDLRLKKPMLVFVDDLTQKSGLGVMPFDYLSYFADNEPFNTIWRDYRYLTTISSSFKTHINPLAYNLQLMYHDIPDDEQVKFETLYLYIRHDGALEMALKNEGKIMRIKINLTDKVQLSAIQRVLSKPGALLKGQNKGAFFSWVSKQYLVYPNYKYKVYCRVHKT